MSRFIASKETPATLQHIFDAAWDKFIVHKGHPSYNGRKCAYRHKSRACAVGLILPLRVARWADQRDSTQFSDVVYHVPELWADELRVMCSYYLNKFQKCLHDDLQSGGMWVSNHKSRAKMYRNVATWYDLKQPPEAPCEVIEERRIRKKDLLADLKAGEEVNGCELVQGTRLEVK